MNKVLNLAPFASILWFYPNFTCVVPDPHRYSEYGSGSKKLPNRGPIRIRIHNTSKFWYLHLGFIKFNLGGRFTQHFIRMRKKVFPLLHTSQGRSGSGFIWSTGTSVADQIPHGSAFKKSSRIRILKVTAPSPQQWS